MGSLQLWKAALFLPLIVYGNALMESYTTKGVKCMSECKFYSNYYFCYLGWGSSNWDYCRVGTTPAPQYYTTLDKGNVPKCTSHCGTFGYNYYWCFTGAGGAWDYCSPRYNTSIYGRSCINPCKPNSNGKYACKTGQTSPYVPNFVPSGPEDISVLYAMDEHIEKCAPSPVNVSLFLEIKDALIRSCSRRTKRLSINVLTNVGVEELANHYERYYPNNIVRQNSPNTPILSYVSVPAPPIPGLLDLDLTMVIRARIYRRHVGRTRENLPNRITTRRNNMHPLPSDHRGHLLASQLGGPIDDFNFVPMSLITNNNQGGFSLWKAVENEVRSRAENPAVDYVDWTIVVAYGDITVNRRPIGFGVRFVAHYVNNQQPPYDSGNVFFINHLDGACTTDSLHVIT